MSHVMSYIFYSGVLTPVSGEQRIELVSRTIETNPAQQRIDVHYYDPTLAEFYAPKTDDEIKAEQERQSAPAQRD